MTTFDDIPIEIVQLITNNLNTLESRIACKCTSHTLKECVGMDEVVIGKEDKLKTIARHFIMTPHHQRQQQTIGFSLWDSRGRVRCKMTRTNKGDVFYNIDDGFNTPAFSLHDAQQMALFERHIVRESAVIVGATVHIKGARTSTSAMTAMALQRRLQSVFPNRKVFVYDNVLM